MVLQCCYIQQTKEGPLPFLQQDVTLLVEQVAHHLDALAALPILEDTYHSTMSNEVSHPFLRRKVCLCQLLICCICGQSLRTLSSAKSTQVGLSFLLKSETLNIWRVSELPSDRIHS